MLNAWLFFFFWKVSFRFVSLEEGREGGTADGTLVDFQQSVYHGERQFILYGCDLCVFLVLFFGYCLCWFDDLAICGLLVGMKGG